MFKLILRRILGPTNLGRIDYFRQPWVKNNWIGRPFNNQQHRQRMYVDLMAAFPIQAILETGTCRGATSALFAKSGLPVYTVEAHPRHFGFSQMRFWREAAIHLTLDDSRAALKKWAHDPSVPKCEIFAYLDAHWNEDLPLREEVAIIFASWPRAIVMIDDFEVPNSTYLFDSYGPTKTLNLDYLCPVMAETGIVPFFPSVAAEQETWPRRGSVVLCKEPAMVAKLESIASLRRAEIA